MGGREAELSRQISAFRDVLGKRHDPVSLPHLMQSQWRDEISAVYAALGGSGSPGFRFGGWDIHLGDIIVELDEEQHFNRYRALTLASPVYRSIPTLHHRDYVHWCADHETACLRKAGHGGYWSKPATDRMFGPSGPEKDLTGRGSSRWKQRAFYDFIRDAWQPVSGVPVVRLSVWETVANDSIRLGEALNKGHPLPPDWLKARIFPG